MALPQGINFRNTGAYVTDGADEYAEIIAGAYPQTTAQGNNVGWVATSGVNPRDRNAANDRRLAGTHFVNDSVTAPVYRIDLPASGSHNVRCAAGDDSNGGNNNLTLFDNATNLGTIVNASPAAGSFVDATNTTYTAANWPGSNTAVNFSFATTTLKFSLAAAAPPGNEIAHFYVESAGSADVNRIRFPSQMSGMGSGGMLGGNRVN